MKRTFVAAVLMSLTFATSAWAIAVPEIDASLWQSGLTLAVGGVVTLMGRRRK